MNHFVRQVLSLILVGVFVVAQFPIAAAQDGTPNSIPVFPPDPNAQDAVHSLFLPITASSSKPVVGDSETVCVIPTGEQGIHYEANPGVPAWGPSTLVAGSDQTFWIADAAANRILQFDATCNLILTIDLAACRRDRL